MYAMFSLVGACSSRPLEEVRGCAGWNIRFHPTVGEHFFLLGTLSGVDLPRFRLERYPHVRWATMEAI